MSGESGDFLSSTMKMGSLYLVLDLVSWATFSTLLVRSVLMSSISVEIGSPLMTTFWGRKARGDVVVFLLFKIEEFRYLPLIVSACGVDFEVFPRQLRHLGGEFSIDFLHYEVVICSVL
ncbi:hypothetical protein TNCT_710831 [Trichonephila clavata]|uniref:Uncharacterized protein n=1 Tax=Trichonephila clavata TaxID=2740835 RepID=A0A8X6KM40_TRICU|nr:hypothetical protein TNCT_710831 [Trichonephila clavata]